MKAVLISIRPEWCARIASGEKTIEVRKNRPKLETPFKCYIYCTNRINGHPVFWNGGIIGNGRVIGEFICDRIEYLDMDSIGIGFWENDNFNYIADLGWNTGLTLAELINYTVGKRVYGWHISELKIYDKPKKLNDFYNYCYSGCDKCEYKSWDYSYAGECKEIVCTVSNKKPLARPPQSWCYVQEI